jgi:hypothetical protein
MPRYLAARGIFVVLGTNQSAGDNEREVLDAPHE